MFREALKAGWYDLQKARDTYRSFVQDEGMHHDLALRFAEVRHCSFSPWFELPSIVTPSQRVSVLAISRQEENRTQSLQDLSRPGWKSSLGYPRDQLYM